MSNAMSMSKSRWKGALLATIAASVLTPLAANAQSMTVGITTNPLGGVTSPNVYSGNSNVYIDPFDKDTLYVYATVTGTSAPSASYVDGLEYLYFNVNAVETGVAGLGSITAATPSALFGGGSFNSASGSTNTSVGSGAQAGALGALSTTPSVVVGSTTTIGSIAKPRSGGNVYVSSPTNSGSNIVVNGNSVSFLVETLTYTPNTTSFLANPSSPASNNAVHFNISIPSVSSYGPYTGANYFVGLPSTPALGTQPASTLTAYSAAATSVNLNDAIPGDANLDGVVNSADAGVVLSNYAKTISGYTNGDLNGDGVVNSADAGIILSNYGESSTGGTPAGAVASPTSLVGSSVPEPASLSLLALAGGPLLVRRRNR